MTAPHGQPAGTLHIAAHQPGYHRHLYYFYKMAVSDIFISLDNVQYVAREWQNRQEFFYRGRRRWLSVPVSRGREPIQSKKITDQHALRSHWSIINSAYNDTPYFSTYAPLLEEIYTADWEYLRDLCDALTHIVREALGITTPYLRASDLTPRPLLARGALLADLIHKAVPLVRGSAPVGHREVTYLACAAPMRADHYLLQPAAASSAGMTERQVIEEQGVCVDCFAYRHPVYRQHQLPTGHPFEAELSAFDLLFNHGPRARGILLSAGGLARQDRMGAEI
ncbi:WbqC family protein [Streptomyces leeuwenhoekii]|uniref:WbqC-Like Family Protein n=1 Tax=Streptomyces leeuwenhoekii TaxID=1437453 RepID=A0A0F7VKS1_STRLW|nr:WbqC family protein [Streptomyces leeuwenhoekii]CQR59594.1 WbqC-Like Family Protein [Streptomyces leeuwenhoekii]